MFLLIYRNCMNWSRISREIHLQMQRRVLHDEGFTEPFSSGEVETEPAPDRGPGGAALALLPGPRQDCPGPAPAAQAGVCRAEVGC